jgi:hypothetical protein
MHPKDNTARQRPCPRPARRSRQASVAEQLAALASRLTDRDRAMLRLVHEHRVFTSHQLGEAFFGSLDRAEHRLRDLADAEVLARFRPYRRHGEGSAPYHYVLGPMGAAVLAAEQGIEVRRLGYRQDKALEVAHSQRLAHTVGVNGFFTALEAHAREHRSQGARLTAWWSERRCRDRWEPIVRPDGYGRWCERGTEVDFFLEYDRGTEPLDRLAAKLAGYQKLAAVTQIPTPVLFWLPSTGREGSVRQALTGEPLWAAMPFPVATASPTLGRCPGRAGLAPARADLPRRRHIDLADLDARTPQPAGPTD